MNSRTMNMIDLRFEEHALGGQTIVTGTSPATGNFTGMIALAATVVAEVLWESGYPATGSWASFTSIPAGTYLPGRFTSITLTSGQVLLVKRKNTP
jgi:hypothetical protein